MKCSKPAMWTSTSCPWKWKEVLVLNCTTRVSFSRSRLNVKRPLELVFFWGEGWKSVSKAGGCTWNAHAARLPGALSAPSASWESSPWPGSICTSRSAPQPESLGWSAPALFRRSSVRLRRTARSWTETTDSPPGPGQTGLGQTAPGSGRPPQSRGCPGCCTSRSSLWGSGSPVKPGPNSINTCARKNGFSVSQQIVWWILGF